jgi:hypothetical protein
MLVITPSVEEGDWCPRLHQPWKLNPKILCWLTAISQDIGNILY